MATKARRIGRDHVELRGDVLTVTTPVQHMAGWDVRRYRASVIRFDGRTWRVTGKAVGPDKLTRYELIAWEPLQEEVTGPEIEYSADEVALRDHAIDTGRRRGWATTMLNVVSPLTGFLPAQMKDRLETLYGIDPVASSQASVFIEAVVALCALALASIAQMVRAYGYNSGLPIWLPVAIAVIAVIDGTVRWSRVLDEVRPAPGFLEWLFVRRR